MKLKAFISLLLFSVMMYAQTQYIPEETLENVTVRVRKTDANIFGHTIDKHTEEHVGFITIRIKGTTIGTATDATGHFYLRNLPADELTVVASGVGYKTIESKVKLESGKSIELNFEIEEDAVMLDNIVVSANRNETRRREAPSIVNVVTPKLFENTNSVCLAQGLNFQPGLRVENNCQNCGFQQVRINGLEGPYSQILIDSRPIFSALAGVYGIEQIPTNMIDRVEVVRGGGSALFGSNAIAGTINIITKEPLNNTLSVSNSTMFIGGTSADINTSVNAVLVSDDYRSGVSIYGSSRQRESWDANGDGFTEIGLITARNIGFRSYFKTGDQSKLTAEYHNLSEFRRGGNNLHLPAHQADITEQTDHNINSGGVKWDFFTPDYKHRLNVFTSAQKINRDSYYGTGQDPNAYGLTNDLSFVAGAQYAFSFEKLFFMPADLTAGAEYNYNMLTDQQLAYERQIDQEMDIKSLFLQNEWKNKALSLLMGMRYDKHKLIENPIFSPRVNLRYNPTEWVNFRASYAEGFRAPQAFDEDLHLTAVGGVVQIIVLDPDLKPEHSRSYSVSADFYNQIGKVQTNLLIEGFYTDIDDVFYLEEAGLDATGQTLLMRKNGSGAVVKGINIEGKVIPSPKTNLQAGFTIQQSLYKETESWSKNPNIAPRREMFRSPNHYGYLTASYNPVKQMTVALSGIYTGSMLVQHYGVQITDDEEVLTPDFFDLGLKLSYDFKLGKNTKLQLNGGIQNIFNRFQQDFDTGETRDAGYMYGPSLPRSFYAGLKLSL
ncbi:MAG: TonB-dependent receptor [Paludibacter sp.]|nr:TonB-dependent receptor [Paludibacter sp.]